MGRTRRLVPQVWRWACCAGASHHSVGLPCLQRDFLDAQAGRCARTRSANVCPRCPDRGKGTCECAALFAANTDISGCLRPSRHDQESQSKYNWAGHTSVPVHTMKSLCEQDGRLYAHVQKFIPRITQGYDWFSEVVFKVPAVIFDVVIYMV